MSVPHGMSVQVVPVDTTMNERYREWKRTRERATPPVASESSNVPGTQERSSPSVVRQLRNILGGLLSFPDEGRGWIRPLGAAVAEVIPRLQPDVMVSSGPPHSIHLGARLGLRESNLPWVVDFRDPWAEHLAAHPEVWLAHPVVARIEGGVIRRATRVLTTTPDLAASMAHRYRGCRAMALPNGVDLETLPQRPDTPAPGLRVAHLGTLYLQRDPTPAIRAFARFVRANPRARTDGSMLSFVGGVEPKYQVLVEETARDEGVTEQVELLPPCSRKEALGILAATGVSLVLAQDQKAAVPAKIYEAVGMGVPTLVITELDSASASTGRKLGAAVHEAHDLEGMSVALERAWRKEWTGAMPSGVLIDYADLAGEAARILGECIASGRRPGSEK